MPEVNANGWMGAEFSGLFFNPLMTDAIPFSPVALPARDESGKDLQLFISDYSISTFFFARFQAQEIVDISSYLKALGVAITTDNIAVAIPELATKYGAGVAVDV